MTRTIKRLYFVVPLAEGAGLTFPVNMTTPIELSSLASLKARISSLTVSGLNAFLLSGRLIVIDLTIAADNAIFGQTGPKVFLWPSLLLAS